MRYLIINNKLSIIGIRGKSTKNSPTYFFSVEYEDVDVLKSALDSVMSGLKDDGFDCSYEGRYHD